MNRIRFLDGMRAVAVLLVIIDHLLVQTNFSLSPQIARFAGFIPSGTFGVKLFFVISGFIITFLLLKEEKKFGSASLKHFYIRRFFRIVPLTYIFITAVAVFLFLAYRRFSWISYVCPLTFTQKLWLYGKTPLELRHLWTLAVEEQFYLFWPWLFVRLGENRRRMRFLALIFLFAFAYRFGNCYFTFLKRGILFYHGGTLAAGCFAALLYGQGPDFSRTCKVVFSPKMRIVFAGLLLAICNCQFPETCQSEALFALMESAKDFLIAAVLLSFLAAPEGWDHRLLTGRPMMLIGVSSFSIYIWQGFFLNFNPFIINQFPFNLVLAVGFGLLSYFTIEKMCLRLKRKYERVT